MGRWVYEPSNRRQTLPGGFLRMNVQSLCLVSSMPRYPQALQELPMVCFLGLTCCKKDKLALYGQKQILEKYDKNSLVFIIEHLFLNVVQQYFS